jgi:hypothetical protein
VPAPEGTGPGWLSTGMQPSGAIQTLSWPRPIAWICFAGTRRCITSRPAAELPEVVNLSLLMLGAGDGRLCSSIAPCVKLLLAKLDAVVALRHSMLGSRGACPYVPGSSPVRYRHEQGLHESVRNWLVFVA